MKVLGSNLGYILKSSLLYSTFWQNPTEITPNYNILYVFYCYLDQNGNICNCLFYQKIHFFKKSHRKFCEKKSEFVDSGFVKACNKLIIDHCDLLRKETKWYRL